MGQEGRKDKGRRQDVSWYRRGRGEGKDGMSRKGTEVALCQRYICRRSTTTFNFWPNSRKQKWVRVVFDSSHIASTWRMHRPTIYLSECVPNTKPALRSNYIHRQKLLKWLFLQPNCSKTCLPTSLFPKIPSLHPDPPSQSERRLGRQDIKVAYIDG